MRNGDDDGQKQAEVFSKLLVHELNDRISSVALASLKTNKFNKPDALPITTDLVKLKGYLAENMAALNKKLTEKQCYSTWRELCELTLTRIILMNKRRGSEASKLLIEAYQNRPNWKDTSNEEVYGSLSEIEKQMFFRIDLVQSQGKQNKKVNTLLMPDMKAAVELLIKSRTACGILSTNKYIFANQENGHLPTWPTLQSVSRRAGLKNPKAVTSNALRKYVSTVCQVMDLTSNEVQWLSDHLAHNTQTYEKFYRLPEATVEIAKIAKLLVATENGDINKYKGKSIQDIQLDYIDLQQDDDNSINEHDELDDMVTEDDEAVTVSRKRKRNVIDDDIDLQQDDDNSINEYDELDDMVTEDDEAVTVSRKRKRNVIDDDVLVKRKQQNKDQCKIRRKRWSLEENTKFLILFRKYIEKGTLPPGNVLSRAERFLPCRTKLQIRTRIHNFISGKQK